MKTNKSPTWRIILRSIFIGLICAMLVTVGFWFSGFDFDKRGSALVWWYILSLIALFYSSIAWFLAETEDNK